MQNKSWTISLLNCIFYSRILEYFFLIAKLSDDKSGFANQMRRHVNIGKVESGYTAKYRILIGSIDTVSALIGFQ